ncbi:S53 family peptidase [Solirubrobacter phytolaccae]|uniref:S53 family peptidase n=1 Tax=Solirubrobacter phytolaccae TaxID=1404360 RepID=A0A9X3S5D2_9ACTN|nr:S53 family peptidase [Solirubrobacter phytolaccae]MDA0178789.1 S53 family peptidase [Solirubrobacter phytolaccae]
MVDRTVLHDSVAPLPDHAQSRPDDPSQRLKLHFALKVPAEHRHALEAAVARGEVIAPEALSNDFGLPDDTVAKLTDWLKSQGFEIKHVSADNTSVYAEAPLDTIERSLKVEFATVTRRGRTHPAARNAPSLPEDLARDVRAIIGLQPHRQARKHEHTTTETRPHAKRPDGYLVEDVLAAYGARELEATGTGQVIAVLIDTFPDAGDLKAFWSANGQPATLKRVTKVNLAGKQPLPAPEGEETLDVQWASGVAPGATVRLYAAGTLSAASIDHALDRIIDDLAEVPGMRQVSVSFGLGESNFGSAHAEIAVQHEKFLRLAAAGVNVFVASGDAGAMPDAGGQSATGALQVEYQASDPYVIAVGGTTLRLDEDGTVVEETAWSGSGGGKSAVFPRPAWQQGAGVPDGTERLVPDVSLVADPETGGLSVFEGMRQPIGGTSWSTPIWAGFCARLNEARANVGKPPLPFLGPLLYPLAGTAAFRDVTSGSNGGYAAGPGYDMVTGLGTPNLAALVAALT